MGRTKKRIGKIAAEIICVSAAITVYGVPFYFVLLNSVKDRRSAGLMNMDWPESFHFIENYVEAFKALNYSVLRGFLNSALITVGSILILVVVCSLAGYVIHRKRGRLMPLVNFLLLAGLMIPPSILPTIYVLKYLGIFKTLPGIILVEVAINIPFATMLYRAYIAAVPREIEEAAVIDGCGRLAMFFKVVFPILMPVTITISVITGIAIFNDFTNPLYFLPGAKNVTVQLTLYNFTNRFWSSWNLLFADAVLITLPPLIAYIFLNKKIVAGIAAGAIKG